MEEAIKEISREDLEKSIKKLIKSYSTYKDVEYIKTGFPTIDLVLGRGIPRGRFVEVVGEPSAFKSFFGYLAIAAFQRIKGLAVMLDTEAKTDRKFAKLAGVDWDNLVYTTPESIEETMKTMNEIIDKAKKISKKIPILIVWDSIGATPSVEELEEENLKKSEMAVRARLISSMLRKVIMRMHHDDITLIGINHWKQKIGTFWAKVSDSPGGKAIKYHSTIRVLFKVRKRIVDSEGVFIGVDGQVETIKNSVAPPFRKCALKFYFKNGFEKYFGLVELLEDLGKITKEKGSSLYQYEGNDKKVQFKLQNIAAAIKSYPEILE